MSNTLLYMLLLILLENAFFIRDSSDFQAMNNIIPNYLVNSINLTLVSPMNISSTFLNCQGFKITVDT